MNVPQSEVRRLKYAVEGCFNGVWGDEPNGVEDMTVVRVADFDRKTARVALGDKCSICAPERRQLVPASGNSIMAAS